MALTPHKHDPNKRDQEEKKAGTVKRLSEGKILDPEKDYKSGPDQDRLQKVKKAAKG